VPDNNIRLMSFQESGTVTKPFRTMDLLKKDSEKIHATTLRQASEIRAKIAKA
jgi:hypothetical protein